MFSRERIGSPNLKRECSRRSAKVCSTIQRSPRGPASARPQASGGGPGSSRCSLEAASWWSSRGDASTNWSLLAWRNPSTLDAMGGSWRSGWRSPSAGSAIGIASSPSRCCLPNYLTKTSGLTRRNPVRTVFRQVLLGGIAAAVMFAAGTQIGVRV